MENQEKNSQEEIKDPEVKKALARGRNANDNFVNDEKDDYQAGNSAEDSEEELRERQTIKGGAGQHGVTRNRNDDFNDEESLKNA